MWLVYSSLSLSQLEVSEIFGSIQVCRIRSKTTMARKMHTYLGYQVVEDEESLRAFNRCIKYIILSNKMKKRVRF
jgi:hypothetical protein